MSMVPDAHSQMLMRVSDTDRESVIARRWTCGREAQFDSPEVLVDALAILGSVGVIVPEGMEVEFDGFASMGGREGRLSNVPAVPGAHIRVRAFGLCGAVKVRTKQHWRRRVDAMLDWLDGRFLGR